jgi:hypothetical protein
MNKNDRPGTAAKESFIFGVNSRMYSQMDQQVVGGTIEADFQFP